MRTGKKGPGLGGLGGSTLVNKWVWGLGEEHFKPV